MAEILSKSLRKINEIMSETDAVYHEAARKFNLTDSALNILYMTYDSCGKRPLKDITATGISKQTVNSSLRKLEKDGIIYLEGKREKTVCLTVEGMNLARDTVGRLIEAENSIFEKWSENETEMYLALSEKFLRDIREEIEKL